MKLRIYSVATLLIIGILAFTETAFGAVVRISWSGNTESDLDGYKVYYGNSSKQYLGSLDVGDTTSVDVSNLGEGLTYYFAVTAYDVNGNESGYSQEVSIAIPEHTPVEEPGDVDKSTGDQGGTIDDTDSGLEPLADSDSDGIPDNVELMWGLNPDDPFDSSLDDDADGAVNLVEYMAGTDPLDPANCPGSDDIFKDVIGQVGDVIDLSWLNANGDLTFHPLMATMPDVLDNTVTATEPGAYLYNVYDTNGYLVYRVRISITANLSAMGAYEPGAPMNLDELLMGITIQISGRAILRDVPVGIGTSFTGAASAVSYGDVESVEFDLLPYGLVLAEPATVSVEIDGENPVVERYDEESGAWETIAGASCADGLVNFSTIEFGKFKVSAEQETAPAASGGGGGCFISSVCP